MRVGEFIEGALNRHRLRELFDRKDVARRSYNLEGSHGDEAYVLASRPGGWAVFYAERGQEVGRRDHEAEDEACHYLMSRVLGDPTTRRSP